MRTRRISRHFGIILRKNHLWFSELLGVGLVVVIISILLVQGTMVLINYTQMKKNGRLISESKAGYITKSHQLQELKNRQKIAAVLNSFTRNRLSKDVLWNLVDLVYTNSKSFGYDPFLVLAVIHVESLFNPRAKGQYRDGRYSGAFGLMQLKLGTAKEVGAPLGITITKKEDLFNPEINIPLGLAYLTKQISYFKSLKLGISAYNQGPGVILNTIKNKTPLSIRYYNKVLTSYFKLKRINTESLLKSSQDKK